MRIALVMEWNFEEPGGVQSHIKGLASKLINQGHYIIVIMKKRINNVNKQDFSTYYIKAPFTYPASIFPGSKEEIFKIIKKEKINLIHIHHIFCAIGISAAFAGNRAGIPIIYTNHTIPLINKKYFLRMLFFHKKALNLSSKIISVSESSDKIIDAFVKDKKKRIVIPNGVDSNLFSPSKSSPIPNSVCFIGRLVPRKGVHVLIKAFSKLKEEIRDARLLIVGDGRRRKDLEFLVKKLKIKDVIFTGHVDHSNLPFYYQQSEVVVIPSIAREAFGIVAIEAMACGKPVVVFNVGGLSEIISNNEDGIIVKRTSSGALCKAIKKLLCDKDLIQKFGKNARDKVEEIYNWEVITNKIIKVYKEVCK